MWNQAIHTTAKAYQSLTLAEQLEPHFSDYLRAVFKGLLCLQKKSQKTELSGKVTKVIQKRATIGLPVFHQFCHLPLAISSALFNVIGRGGDLDQSSFTSFFKKLLLGDVDDKLSIAFQLLAGKRQDVVAQDEIHSLLVHVIKAGGCAIKGFDKLRAQIPQSVEELLNAAIGRLCDDQPLNHKRKREVSYLHFYQFSKYFDSDIPQLVRDSSDHQILCFIYKRMKILEKFKKFALYGAQEVKVGALTENSIFGAEFYGFQEIGHVRYMYNDSSIRYIWHLNFTSSQDVKQAKSESDSSLLLLSKAQRRGSCNEESILQRLGFKEGQNLQQFANLTQIGNKSQRLQNQLEEFTNSQQKLEIKCSGHVYRFLKKNVIRAFWYELNGFELYMFDTKSSHSPKMILSLGSGFSITDKTDLDISPKNGNHSDQPLYSFELVFPSGLKKEFLFFDCFEKRAWLSAFQSVLSDFSFENEYEVLNEVEEIEGEISYKGFSLITGEPVVLSVLPKRPDVVLSTEEQDKYEARLLSRLEVMRICEHPLIPRVIDIHETPDYFCIAQEPSEGGDLASYFKREGVTSKVVGHILSQMGEVLCFLSKMNILVGNLRLSSFFLAEAIGPSNFTTLPQIRLVDLSEACILGCGPLFNPISALSLYSAPELVLQ